MASDFIIKKGDRLPGIAGYLTSPAGGLDLASGVVFSMESQDTPGTIKTGTATIESATDTLMRVRYDWGATDTDTVGLWNGEWVVTIGGKEMTFPADGFVVVEVQDDIS